MREHTRCQCTFSDLLVCDDQDVVPHRPHLMCLNCCSCSDHWSLTCCSPLCVVPAVDAIFQALCEGALANPDPDAEEDEGDFFYDEV
jgi:hypothetical protein